MEWVAEEAHPPTQSAAVEASPKLSLGGRDVFFQYFVIPGESGRVCTGSSFAGRSPAAHATGLAMNDVITMNPAVLLWTARTRRPIMILKDSGRFHD